MIFDLDNIILRPWADSDAECLYHFAKNPNVGPIAGWPPHESVEYSLNIIKTLFHPDTNHWWGDNSAELGYWIAEQYWGNNYATEASEFLIKRAFDKLNVNQIFATYRCENYRSKRVLEKLGFKYYGELNNIDYLGNAFREIAVVIEK